MKSDLSRVTFDSHDNYSGVIMQQGRVQLDADCNESDDINDRRFRTTVMDITGLGCVVSSYTPDAFRISFANNEMNIQPGRMYVDGLLAENHGQFPFGFEKPLEELKSSQPVQYNKQPYLPEPLKLPLEGYHLIYLDVWHREITYLQHDLIEKALGIDTTGRQQTVWQVKALKLDTEHAPQCDDEIQEWFNLTAPSAGRLTTSTNPVSDDNDPCKIPPGAGYRGMENRLYRVEIHKGGKLGAAKFKWSRVNASVGSKVKALHNNNQIELSSLGRDNYLRFKIGDWIELLDDHLEFKSESGFMSKVIDIDEERLLLTFDPPISANFNLDDPKRHTRVVRWDQKHDLDANGQVSVTGSKIDLEDGIQVEFSIDPANPDGEFKIDDFWVFAARSVDGSIEHLHKVPPRGIHHHLCKLAVVGSQEGQLEVIHDCRQFFSRPKIDPVKPGVHIKDVLIKPEGDQYSSIQNDTDIIPKFIERGIHIRCDSAIAKESATRKPVCILSVELPHRVREIPVNADKFIGYQSIILAAETLVDENLISWLPVTNSKNWLVGHIGDLLNSEIPGWDNRILARLKVMGNFIWELENPSKYLDGEGFGTLGDDMTHIHYPSGDNRRGGNFEMWFWLVR